MSVLEIFLIAIALGMDAFSVAICKGLAMSKLEWKKGLKIAGFFGFFQALMPTLGYMIGKNFESYIIHIDHWIAFILLLAIGLNLLKDGVQKNADTEDDKFDFKTLFGLGIATSIDALAVGITFSFLEVGILLAVLIIGMTAFVMSVIGIKIGSIIGDKFNQKAKLLGGFLLIAIGLKILIEHLFFN